MQVDVLTKTRNKFLFAQGRKGKGLIVRLYLTAFEYLFVFLFNNIVSIKRSTIDSFERVRDSSYCRRDPRHVGRGGHPNRFPILIPLFFKFLKLSIIEQVHADLPTLRQLSRVTLCIYEQFARQGRHRTPRSIACRYDEMHEAPRTRKNAEKDRA